MITKRSISKPNSIEEFGEIAISKKKRSFSFSCSRPLSSSQTTTRHHPHPKPTKETRLTMMGIEPHHNRRCGVAVREPKSMPAPLLDAPHDRHARRPTPLFHTSNPHTPGTSGARGHTPATTHGHRTAPRSLVGWRSGSPKAYPYHSRTGRIPSKPLISSTPASPCETVEPFHEHGAHTGHGTVS